MSVTSKVIWVVSTGLLSFIVVILAGRVRSRWKGLPYRIDWAEALGLSAGSVIFIAFHLRDY